MKIVVIGGTGLIGTKVVKNLPDQGHEVVAASPSKGINAFTGEGLAQALAGAQAVVDVAKAPYFGLAVNDQSLTPGDKLRLGPTYFTDWLSRQA